LPLILKGLAWEHPRSYAPLEASVGHFEKQFPKITIAWERRSLFEFGEGSIVETAASYDLVLFDHPFVGEIAKTGAFLDFKQYLTEMDVAHFEQDSLGPSFVSYLYGPHLFALPIDAAAQVSLYRPDLFERGELYLPRRIDDISRFTQQASDKGLKIVTPLKQIDALCLLFTLSATLGSPVRSGEKFMEPQVFGECAAILKALDRISVPGSTKRNPIEAYEIMKASTDVAYCPFSFGYSNYARNGEVPLVLASDCPIDPGSSRRASCIGGVGIGVSNCSQNKVVAVGYAKSLCAGEYQRSQYVANGGQPASRSAWTDRRVNQISNGFFENTLATLETAYLRPRFAGFMKFAREAGAILVAMIEGDVAIKQAINRLSDEYESAQRIPS
jgi:multiple sugar transport system substrate-binding protein